MLKVVNNAIYLTRGDTAILQLSIKQDDGSDYAIADTDNVLFTIKKSTKEKTVILQKSVMDGKIKINPEETSSLEYGTYFGGADIFLDHSGSTYIIPKLSLYSTGLMPPKVILIRSSLYQ